MKKVFISVALLVALASCESKSARLAHQRTASQVETKRKETKLVHPDQLKHHIFVSVSYQPEEPVTDCLVYDYEDSTYSEIEMPTTYTQYLHPGDTINSRRLADILSRR